MDDLALIVIGLLFAALAAKLLHYDGLAGILLAAGLASSSALIVGILTNGKANDKEP